MRHFRIEPEHFSIFRRWGLEDVGVDAFLFQEAVITCLAFYHTDDPFEGVSKAAAKGRAFIGREAYLPSGTDGKPEFCQPECFEYRNENFQR